MYDIAIIGAGPAGATFARMIGKSYKVLLVDKRDIMCDRTYCVDVPEEEQTSKQVVKAKCCGGLLAPDAQRVLSELGLKLPGEVLEEPQLSVVRAIDISRNLEGYYRRHYINIDRNRFDEWLLSQVPAEVTVHTQYRLTAIKREKDYFHLTLNNNDSICSEQAKIVVGADGAASKVRSELFPEKPFPKKYIALQEWVVTKQNDPYYSSFFDPEVTDFYCWSIPKGDYTIIGAAIPSGKNVRCKFELFKEKLAENGYTMDGAVRREGALILRPVRSEQILTGTKKAAFLGEAAGFISPSSAEGISYAFKSAAALANALESSLDGFEDRYRRLTWDLRKRIVLKNIKAWFIFTPTPRRIILKSGIRSIRRYRSQA
jgi:flavin-dependent dehydrogenase